jgi:hypothetical protein
MPKTNAKADPHVQKAMGFLKSFPNMAISLAMKLADFTPQEQACRNKQIWIRCQFDKKASKHITVQMSSPTMPVSVDLADDNKGLLSVTMSKSVTDSTPASPPIQQPTINGSIGGMVMWVEAVAMETVEVRARAWQWQW